MPVGHVSRGYQNVRFSSRVPHLSYERGAVREVSIHCQQIGCTCSCKAGKECSPISSFLLADDTGPSALRSLNRAIVGATIDDYNLCADLQSCDDFPDRWNQQFQVFAFVNGGNNDRKIGRKRRSLGLSGFHNLLRDTMTSITVRVFTTV